MYIHRKRTYELVLERNQPDKWAKEPWTGMFTVLLLLRSKRLKIT